MYFLTGINTKYLWNIPKEKYFALFRIPNLFIKSFVNPLAGIALTFPYILFNSFLFEVIFLFNLLSLLLKSVFFMELEILFWLATFSCGNLVAKLSNVNLLNSWVVIYWS